MLWVIEAPSEIKCPVVVGFFGHRNVSYLTKSMGDLDLIMGPITYKLQQRLGLKLTRAYVIYINRKSVAQFVKHFQ